MTAYQLSIQFLKGLTTATSAQCHVILDLFVLGNRAKDSSKDDWASLLISTHLTDLYKGPTKQAKGQKKLE